jgi:O-antigen ligase
MKRKGQSDRKSDNLKLVLLTAFLIPIFITPWFNLDPISLPRMALISLAGITQLPNLIFKNHFDLQSLKVWKCIKENSATTWLLFFSIFSILTLFNAPKSMMLQLLGGDSRNAGFVTMLSLTLVALAIISFANSRDATFIVYSVLAGGALNLIYGIFQLLDLDPVDWKNPYGPIIGTMGNPNFMSAYLGIFTVLIFSQLSFRKNLGFKTRIILAIVFCSSVYMVQKTDSIQGLVVTAAGISIVLLLRYRGPFSGKFSLLSFIALFGLGAMFVLGFLGKGILGDYLFQSTLEVRFFYWKAGLAMILAKPIFGHGFDSFGTWYTFFRDKMSTEEYGAGLVSDSAHNYFLDLGVSGGIPLVTSYLIVQLLILKKAIRVLTNKNDVSWQYKSAFVAWLGFQMQSLISPMQLVLLFTGFILGAVLLRDDLASVSTVKFSELTSTESSWSTRVLYIFLSSTILISSYEVLNVDHHFRAAFAAGEGNAIRNSSLAWPLSERRLVIASRVFYTNGYNVLGRELALRALSLNPNNLDVLRILIQDASITGNRRAEMIERVLLMDPYGPEAMDKKSSNNS